MIKQLNVNINVPISTNIDTALALGVLTTDPVYTNWYYNNFTPSWSYGVLIRCPHIKPTTYLKELLNFDNINISMNPELFGKKVIEAVKAELPDSMPLVMRVSAVEYTHGGYNLDYLIDICKKFKDADLIAVGRGKLRNPYWAMSAAEQLNAKIDVPEQYSTET